MHTKTRVRTQNRTHGAARWNRSTRYLDVEAALPLGGQRRGVEIELDPVHDLAAVVVAAVPLPLLAGGRRGTGTRGGGDDAADEGEPRRALGGLW
jgi:hypothetical protein